MYLQVQCQPSSLSQIKLGTGIFGRAEFTFVEHRDLNIESEINSVSLDFI